MQRLHCFTAIVLLSAHTVLGCCAHHACGTLAATNEVAGARSCGRHGLHDAQGHGESPHRPAQDGNCPLDACMHGSCSFVKADPVSVDDGSADTPFAITIPVIAETLSTARDAIQPANVATTSSSARLYVCYCALLL